MEREEVIVAGDDWLEVVGETGPFLFIIGGGGTVVSGEELDGVTYAFVGD